MAYEEASSYNSLQKRQRKVDEAFLFWVCATIWPIEPPRRAAGMPRIRPKIPFNYATAIDPVEAARKAGPPKETSFSVAGSLPASTSVGHQRFIDLAERFIPEDNLAEAVKITAPWININAEGEPQLMPDEAVILQVALYGIFAAPAAFKSLRKQFKISLEEIADKCDVKYTTVFRWETGQTSIPPNALSTLCEMVGKKTLQTPMTGKNIVWLRETYNLSQAQLAKIIGVAPLTIFNWEKRGALPLPKSASAKIRVKYPTVEFPKAA